MKGHWLRNDLKLPQFFSFVFVFKNVDCCNGQVRNLLVRDVAAFYAIEYSNMCLGAYGACLICWFRLELRRAM